MGCFDEPSLCVILGTARCWGQARPCVIPAGQERLLSGWKRILPSGRDQEKPIVRAGPAGFKQTHCASSPTSRCWWGGVLPPLPGMRMGLEVTMALAHPFVHGSTNHCLVGIAVWQDNPDLDHHRQPVTMDVHSKGAGGRTVFPAPTFCRYHRTRC